jgi:ketosteroid isomerase-like protein
MAEDSTTTDLAERVRSIWVQVNRQDWDAVGSFFAPEAVWDLAAVGLGTFTGQGALRSLWKDWTSSYEEIASEVDPVLDLGNGVVFAVVRQKGRISGSTGSVEAQAGWVYEWVGGTVARVTIDFDLDAARAAAERLAKERG